MYSDNFFLITTQREHEDKNSNQWKSSNSSETRIFGRYLGSNCLSEAIVHSLLYRYIQVFDGYECGTPINVFREREW